MPSHQADGDASFEKPVPRRPKTTAKLAQLQVQNRRREYLQRNPSYLRNLEHELADPILYERLVKRFQTPAEREAEGKAKGYGRTLEADLVRGETKLSNIAQPSRSDNGRQSLSKSQTPMVPEGLGTNAWDGPAESKDDGLGLWHAFLEERFVHGGDEEFDYAAVDANDEYDVVARREAEDAWFDEEEPSWVAEGDSPGTEASTRQGETGVQDF